MSDCKLTESIKTVDILGVRLAAIDMKSFMELICQCVQSRSLLLIGVVNAAKLVTMRSDAILRHSIEQADIVLADGLSVVWLSRALGRPLPARVAGIDIMLEILKAADRNRWRVYFLGAKPDVLARLVKNIQRDFPGVQIAGFRDGYFTDAQQQDVVAAVRNSNADVIFVGISPPKKEIFLGKWYKYLGVPVCHGVGGSFDVVAGVTKRAPLWMQNYGLEWFYRLIQEPRRMWKRYLVTNFVFIVLGIGAVIRTRLCGLRGRSKVDIAD